MNGKKAKMKNGKKKNGKLTPKLKFLYLSFKLNFRLSEFEVNFLKNR